MTDTPVFGQLYDAILKAKRVLVVGDGRPDGDSVGSSTALVTWLLNLNKDVTAFCSAPVMPAYAFLDNAYRFSSDSKIFDQAFDLILICDAGDLKHGGIQDLLPRTPKGFKLVDIDHHATNARYGDMNVVFPAASSTCEVVYRFFEENKIALDDRMATSLLTGILSDTSTFTNAATTTKSLEAASKLVSRGARFNDIIRYEFKNRSAQAMQIWGLAMSRLQHNKIYDVAWTYLKHEDLIGVQDDTLDGIANFLNAVCGFADAILVLRETADGQVKGSLRSMNRDISKLAKLLGGGGHKKAAGFSVPGRLLVEGDCVKIQN